MGTLPHQQITLRDNGVPQKVRKFHKANKDAKVNLLGLETGDAPMDHLDEVLVFRSVRVDAVRQLV